MKRVARATTAGKRTGIWGQMRMLFAADHPSIYLNGQTVAVGWGSTPCKCWICCLGGTWRRRKKGMDESLFAWFETGGSSPLTGNRDCGMIGWRKRGEFFVPAIQKHVLYDKDDKQKSLHFVTSSNW
jgi:hypothetical protein